MAAIVLAERSARLGESPEWIVESAGTWAAPDLPVTELAGRVLATRGLHADDHRSRPLTADLMRSAGLVLVMTRDHLEAIYTEFPDCVGKTHLLSNLIGRAYDIMDPAGGGIEDYEICLREIERIIDAGWSRLVELTDPI